MFALITGYSVIPNPRSRVRVAVRTCAAPLRS